jgi:hypothetical protein
LKLKKYKKITQVNLENPLNSWPDSSDENNLKKSESKQNNLNQSNVKI